MITQSVGIGMNDYQIKMLAICKFNYTMIIKDPFLPIFAAKKSTVVQKAYFVLKAETELIITHSSIFSLYCNPLYENQLAKLKIFLKKR